MSARVLDQFVVLAALNHDEALAVSEVAARACVRDAWRHRTNVRNRLYALERQGLAICDDNRPQRWMLPCTVTR